MPDIKESVGVGGRNQTHDVALVQAMLRIVKDAKQQPYLGADYDGVYGEVTRKAIVRFQDDHKLAQPPQPPLVLLPPPQKQNLLPQPFWQPLIPPAQQLLNKDLSGLVKPGGTTINKLSAMLPADAKDLRIIPNTKTVYVAGVGTDATASAKAIRADEGLEATFREKVAKLVDLMFERHKIVLWIAPQGGRRDFAQQAALPANVTQAGPGESNHNFGRAVDIGFRGLRWITGAGAIKKDADWLNALEKASPAKSNDLWAARNKIAVDELKLFKTSLAGDVVHLQAYDDANVSMTRSLAHLLSTVGTMQWQRGYKCNLGGNTFHAVGTAKAIWGEQATVTKQMVATAWTEAKGKPFAANDVTEQQVAAMRTKLKGDFELADQSWKEWVPK